MSNLDIKFKRLTPFKRCVLQNFPFIEADFDALTNYGLLCKIVEYLNQVIASQNEVQGVTEEIVTAFNNLYDYVHDYFENLDVQEEINNKLDQMTEDGTLQEIIGAYLNANAVWGFDTVADMKASANLVNGSYARTLGYYTKNDDGGALYKIRNITNDDVVDNGSIIPLDDPQNQLIAELISLNVYPEMFGAYGDGVHNDTTSFNNAINYSNTLTLKGYKTYKLTSLNIAKDLTINGNGATLIDDTAVDKFITVDTLEGSVKTLRINDLNIDVPNSNYGIYIDANILYGKNIKISRPSNACFICNKGNTSGRYGTFIVDNIECRLSNIGIDVQATDCFINGYHGYNCKTHINVARGLTHINTAHGWNFNTSNVDWVTGSVLINIVSDVVMNDIYSDTLESTFVLPSGSTHQYMTVKGTNISQFLNTSSYPNTQASPLLVKNIENYTGWIKLTNISANANNWKDSDNKQPVLFPTTFSQIKANFDNVSAVGYRYEGYIPVVVEGDVQTSEYTVTTEVQYISPNIRKRWEYKNEKRLHWYFALSRDLPDNTCIFSAQMAETSRFSNINAVTKKVNVSAKFISSSNQGLSYDLDANLHNGLLTIYNHTGLSLNNGAVVFNYNLEDV